ncbi:STAS domain-containing protein [Streptomyces dubilierae]|uniref:Anti-sigma factor antagonist n=1 Tax=Streptomyces dubilierae TaxID=3075533 RepID=A0ABU2P455_9ACTN|nr:STAS domain-containing protein [Streptomyces sp. DSM 41921]MDT0386641.1 STAS domain-containing protein [Streptomyces sp. DSM 41921]
MSESTRRSTPRPAESTARVVTVRGEMDLLTAPALRDRLDLLTAGPCPDLVLDLRAVSFIDCTGLGVLCRARNRVLARRGRLRLVGGGAFLRRLFRYTGVAGAFEVLPGLPPTAADAMGARSAGEAGG